MTTEDQAALELESLPKFKARPVNKKILQSQQPLNRQPNYELTVPMSPAITKPKPALPLPPSPPRILKANPVPRFPPPKPLSKEKSLVVPDFSLPGDEISDKKRLQFEQALSKEREEAEKARLFKAHPLPSEVPHVLFFTVFSSI